MAAPGAEALGESGNGPGLVAGGSHVRDQFEAVHGLPLPRWHVERRAFGDPLGQRATDARHVR